MIRKVVRVGILYTACFPHTRIPGWGIAAVRGEGASVREFAFYPARTLAPQAGTTRGTLQAQPLQQRVKWLRNLCAGDAGREDISCTLKKTPEQQQQKPKQEVKTESQQKNHQTLKF